MIHHSKTVPVMAQYAGMFLNFISDNVPKMVVIFVKLVFVKPNSSVHYCEICGIDEINQKQFSTSFLINIVFFFLFFFLFFFCFFLCYIRVSEMLGNV